MNNVGLNIRRLREKRGYSQEALAYELGINQSTYCKLEKKSENLSLGRLMKITEVLKGDLVEILELGQKNISDNQSNYGNDYVETKNNDFRDLIQEIKVVYEKLGSAKDDEISLLKSLLDKK